MTEVSVRPIAGHVGAEIEGLSLNTLDDAGFATVRDALFAHGVVFFRDQDLSHEGHIALAERFGTIDVNRFFTPVATHPQIAEVRTEPHHAQVIGGTWHTDHSYDAAPAMCSILVARELPPFGGDTLFASQTAAYEHLSDGLKLTLEGLNAWHSDASFSEGIQDERLSDEGVSQPVLHPAVIRHPQTGQKALYVNGDFTTHFEGWSRPESQPLLDYLYDYCTQPAFACRFRWEPGSVAIWDNRLVQHYAVADYQGSRRLMHRVTVEGQVLGGVPA
ncbi:TauD/TfdA dioxygenase family protein [Falsiruegeria mediterranea]